MTDEPQSDIQKLISTMNDIKLKDKKVLDSIQYQRNKKKNRMKQEDLVNLLPKIKDKKEIQQEMKNHMRNAWKAPADVNKEFSNVPVLRGKVLTEWEIYRIYMSERSYKAPAGYKGFKTTYIPQEFAVPGNDVYPPHFVKYLESVNDKFIDFQLRPSKYGKVHLDEVYDKIQWNKQVPFCQNNTVQNKEFRFTNPGFNKRRSSSNLKTLTKTDKTSLKTLTKTDKTSSQQI